MVDLPNDSPFTQWNITQSFKVIDSNRTWHHREMLMVCMKQTNQALYFYA